MLYVRVWEVEWIPTQCSTINYWAMKQKNKKANLAARQKAYEALSDRDKQSRTKPGSLKK